VRYDRLDNGWHILSVQATDDAGNVDESPATLSWHPTDDDSLAE